MESFKGKTILITEAGEGIGKELLMELLTHHEAEKVIAVSELTDQLIRDIEKGPFKRGQVTMIKGKRYDEKTLQKVFENKIDYIIDTPKAIKEDKGKRPNEIIHEISSFPLLFDYMKEKPVKKYLLVSTSEIIQPITLEASEKALKEKIVLAMNDPEHSNRTHYSAIRLSDTHHGKNTEKVSKALQVSKGGEIILPLNDLSQKTEKELFNQEEREKIFQDAHTNSYMIIPDLTKYWGEKEDISRI